MYYKKIIPSWAVNICNLRPFIRYVCSYLLELSLTKHTTPQLLLFHRLWFDWASDWYIWTTAVARDWHLGPNRRKATAFSSLVRRWELTDSTPFDFFRWLPPSPGIPCSPGLILWHKKRLISFVVAYHWSDIHHD